MAEKRKPVQTADGVIVYPAAHLGGNAQWVRLQVINDQIIRVLASPTMAPPTAQSFMVITGTQPNVKWEYKETGEQVELTTAALVAKVNQQTGQVAFFAKNGDMIVQEPLYNGRQFTPAVFSGRPSYGISQTFAVAPNEAFYGLGQHQDDLFNYKDQQVTFFQNNTEVAIPFLVSNKNYGILWDNYSISTIGDVRPFKSLSDLRLFSSKGEEGWLTAAYANDAKQPNDIAFEKAESIINYAYLGDTKLHLPANFNIAKGQVTYTGSIASAFSGVHKFKFTYAGYVKVWINDKLLLDRWRQAWNPGTAVLNIPFEKGQHYKFRMEWIPDGGESYLTTTWLNPIEPSQQNTFTFASEAGQQLDYYFVYGQNLDEVISGYRTLTGKAQIAPKWAFGKWQSRERYKTQEEILSTVATFRQQKIPLDNIVLDWSYWKQDDWGSQEFDKTRFSNPDSMIKVLHEQYKTQFMISVWPKFYEGIEAYKKFNDSGWLYTRNIADRQRDWIGQGYISTFYDAFNPAARKGFWDLIYSKLYVKGIDAWWMDASEPDILSNVSPAKRKEQMGFTAAGLAAETLNAYPLENARGIYENARQVDPNKRVFLLTRSGYGGSQRYAATIWSGDIASRWSDMKAQISAGLNFSLSGLPYWTMDIGGFSVEKRYENAQGADLDEWRELNTRWYQFGAFSPIFRVHGQYPYREIYNIAPGTHPAYQSMRYYDHLRYRFLPYIYSLAGATYFSNYTPMRALVMDFPKDSLVRNIGDQYLLGPSLLVNPVYEYKATSREMYLPEGPGWYDFYTNKYYEGGQTIVADAPYERMPLFVKAGSIMPYGPSLQYVAEKPADPITLYVYTGADASFTLYEDEGLNYNYEKGAYAKITLQYNDNSKVLTIGQRQGNFKGMLTQRTFKIVWVNQVGAKPFDLEAAPNETLHYKGKEMVVRMK
ncbi:TIM-barrel domain-containing protein [Chitinophaga skermanii]|uniref:TIM-barrel domain-containing protein n=1 Tax=Chitinophaga skermanii TaxID=331697 RepID=UPI001FE27C00|nr:TIM-barrel domain-containing protein [Chitinophaga skermanii]